MMMSVFVDFEAMSKWDDFPNRKQFKRLTDTNKAVHIKQSVYAMNRYIKRIFRCFVQTKVINYDS